MFRRRFLATALLFLQASVALAGGDQLLCAIETDRPLASPREFKVVALDKNGNGNSKALLMSSYLTERGELRARLGPDGEVTEVVMFGAVIPVGKLLSPGISLQVSESHLGKEFTRDLIRMIAVKTPGGYALRVNTLKSGGFLRNPSWPEFWTVAKDKEGKWGFVYARPEDRMKGPVTLPAGGEDPMFVQTIRVKLTLKDDQKPFGGFKGITEYAMVPRAVRITEDIAHSSDQRLFVNTEKKMAGGLESGGAVDAAGGLLDGLGSAGPVGVKVGGRPF